ncbi:transient receptor potential cation channel subfamily A member 1a [Aplochiton taeniatus]
MLLSHSGSDVNLEGDLGNTPAMLACSVDNHEGLRILFKQGARLCQQNKLGHYPIHAAAFVGAKRSMQVILETGEEMGYSTENQINYLDKSFCSPLHLAVRGGNLDVIKLCIERGARIDQQQCDKSTALHFACTQGATEAVKFMLLSYDKISDIINIRDGASQTPLHRTTIFDHHELAEYLISKGADVNSIDCKGHTPLLLATSCSAWKTVNLLLSHGANLNIRDKAGCNFLHLAILQPKGLRNLSPEVLQLSDVGKLLCAEDSEGCTPLLYACRLGVPDSVNNMLGLNVSLDHKSKQKKSALHFAAEYGRFNTCERLLDSMAETRLLNEGDDNGMTPLHLASRNGHVRVVEMLLRRGALFHSDYRGWSCLHHAASEGFTQTMSTLLASNVKLLDNMDEDGNSALHMASREGHTAAVLLLLDRGAKVELNKMSRSFIHEAVLNNRRDTADAIIKSDRCAEALLLFSTSENIVVLTMIEVLPESFKTLLDTCLTESEDDVNSPNYSISYNFRWLQAPILVKKLAKLDRAYKIQPLAALNAMVRFHRIELLTHPVCTKYLEMKWDAYGMKAHLLNLVVYSFGLLPLTHILVNLRPLVHANRTDNVTSITMVNKGLHKQDYFLTICMFLILAMNLYAIGKEVVQIFQQRCSYLNDLSNWFDWVSATSSLLFVVPLLLGMKETWPWQAGAIAALASWTNFLFYLQRFEHIGIYVVMFREIAKTLLRIIVLFFFLILAFSLSFYALMINKSEFATLTLAVMQTFVMMVGELNYQDNILGSLLDGTLAFPFLTYNIFIWFILLVPILLMNLLIGLAVGDIAEVQSQALLKQIGMQIDLHTNLEEKLPYWFMKRVDKECVVDFPNKSCGKKGMCDLWGENGTRTRLNADSQQCVPLEREINKQKYRLKEMSSLMEKQHNLLKLIIQKMEISSEAEESDGPDLFSGHRQRTRGPQRSRSKWDPLIHAITAKDRLWPPAGC